MANKENILKTDECVNDVTDKLQTLTLGGRKSSPPKKFNLNVWSTPLKAVGNILAGKANFHLAEDATVAPVKLQNSILEKNETPNDENVVSSAVEMDLFGNAKKILESCQEMQQITLVTNIADGNKCSETSSDTFEDCTSVDDVSDNYNEEYYESTGSSHGEDYRSKETAADLTQRFDGINNESFLDLTQFSPNEFNETQDMIERYLEGSITFVGSVNNSHGDSPLNNDVLVVENMEKEKHSKISNSVERIYETAENEHTIHDNMESPLSSEIRHEASRIEGNDRILDTTERDSLTEILSDLLDNISEQNASERNINVSNHECRTVSFLSNELENVGNSVEKNTNIKVEPVDQSLNVSKFILEVNEVKDFETAEMNNETVAHEKYNKMDVNASVCEIDIVEESKNQTSYFEKNNTEITNRNLSSTSSTFKKSTESGYDIPNLQEVHNQQIDASTSSPDVHRNIVEEPRNQLSNLEKNDAKIMNESSSFNSSTFLEKPTEKAPVRNTETQEKFDTLQIDADMPSLQIRTDTVEEPRNQIPDLEKTDTEIVIGISSFLEKSTKKALACDTPPQEKFGEQPIDASMSSWEIRTKTVEEPRNQKSDLEKNDTEIVNVNSSFSIFIEKSTEKTLPCDSPTQGKFVEQEVDTNTSILGINTNTVEEPLPNQTSDFENSGAELTNGNLTFNSLRFVEKLTADAVSCDISIEEKLAKLQIVTNTSDPEIKADASTIEESKNVTFQFEEKGDPEVTHGNLSFGSLTVFEKSTEKAVVCDAPLQIKFDELSHSEVTNRNSSFGSVTVFEESNENTVPCGAPILEKFEELPMDKNVTVSEIKADVVEQMNQTFNLEMTYNSETTNGNSSFGSLTVIEKSTEDSLACNALTQVKLHESSHPKVANGNSSFGSLTVFEESNEKTVTCGAPTLEKFEELLTDENVTVSEIKADAVEQTHQTSNLEMTDNSEITNGNSSFGSLTVIEKSTEEAVACNALTQVKLHESSHREVTNKDSSFGSLTVIEKSGEKTVTCGAPTLEKFEELLTDENVTVSEIKADAVEQTHQTSNLEMTDNSEITNGNSSFGSLTVIEKSTEEAVACNALTQVRLDESSHREVTNKDSSFGSLTVIEKSGEEAVTCGGPSQEKFEELLIDGNVTVSEIEAGTGKQINETFNLEMDDNPEITNGNSPNSLKLVEKSAEEAVACDAATKKNIDKLCYSEVTNGNSSFGSLTVIEESNEESTAHEAPNQEKFAKLQTDTNGSISEMKTDTVEQSASHTSNLEENNAEIMNENLSFSSSTFVEKLTKEAVTPDVGTQGTYDEQQIDVNKFTPEKRAHVVEESPKRTLHSERNYAEMMNGNLSFNSSTFIEKSVEKAVACDILTQDKFNELHIDVNTSNRETVTDTIQLPPNVPSNLENNNAHENASLGLLIFAEKLTDENLPQGSHITLADETLVEDDRSHKSNFVVSNEIVSFVPNTPTTFTVPNDSLRSTKIKRLKDHFNEMLSPFRENLIRFRTPMKRGGHETPRQSYNRDPQTNPTTKIVFELPGSILDLSIGELESLTSKKFPAVQNTNSEVLVEPSASPVSVEINDVAKSSVTESPKLRKLDFEKAETEDSKSSLQKELEETKKEFANFATEHEVLLQKYDALWEKYSKLRKQYDEVQQTTEKLAEAAKSVLAHKISLEKAIKDYEDIARVSSNKYELLKEYSNTLIMQMNKEMEEKEKEISTLKSKMSK